MLILDRADFDYVPYYCEENVWRLLARRELSAYRAWALLISSPSKDFVMLRQRSGRPVDGMVHWDYHAVCLVEPRTEGMYVIDFDTELPFPCPAARYVDESFPKQRFSPRSTPSIRMIEAAVYRADFVSDRSHMRRPDGSWRAPPPSWPWPGSGTDRANVLDPWTDMGNRSPGRVLEPGELAELAARAEHEARRLRGAR